MKYLLLGLVVTLLLATFTFAMMTRAVFVELWVRAGRGKSGRGN